MLKIQLHLPPTRQTLLYDIHIFHADDLLRFSENEMQTPQKIIGAANGERVVEKVE